MHETNQPSPPSQGARAIAAYTRRVSDGLLRSDAEMLARIADTLVAVKENGARIFTAGNGGSASTASHFCNDLVKGCRVDGRVGFSAMSLCDPTPVVTCLANDFSYDEIFALQLQTHASAADALVLFSGSGNSPNILHAARYAQERGMCVIGFTGRDGGALKDLCDLCMIAPSQSMEEIEDLHLAYCHSLIGYLRDTLADRWGIEIIRRPPRSCAFRSALFDFDGTVSLLREGWQQVMIPYFNEILAAAETNPDMDEINRTVTDFVDLLTGKQTIFQCMQLDEEVQKRGGAAVDPYVYKAEYLRRLTERIHHRLEGLRNGSADPSAYITPGCVAFLRALRERGVKLYLASGTDEANVLEEARLLGVDSYFDGGIYGARDGMLDCAKELVIRRILEENGISSAELMSFGDGYVEIELIKNIGGYAVAVASDEVRRKGVDAWKRKRLLSANADAVIPDFERADALAAFLFENGACV